MQLKKANIKYGYIILAVFKKPQIDYYKVSKNLYFSNQTFRNP